MVEISEDGRPDERYLQRKRFYVERWGCRIALDDFGTGYNSEALLLRLTPDFIKLDISIIENIGSDESRKALLRNIVGFAKEQGIKVIAEGVETEEELRELIVSGVDYLQGFYLGMPGNTPEEVKPEVLEEIRRILRPLH